MIKKNKNTKVKSKWSLSSRFLYILYSFLLLISIIYLLADISLRIYFNREFWNMVSMGLNVLLLVNIIENIKIFHL